MDVSGEAVRNPLVTDPAIGRVHMRGLRLAVAGVLAAAVVLPAAPAAAVEPAVAPAMEAAAPAQPATLTFASFNICKVNCGDEAGLPWSLRR